MNTDSFTSLRDELRVGGGRIDPPTDEQREVVSRLLSRYEATDLLPMVLGVKA
jgi:hypothetical protein